MELLFKKKTTHCCNPRDNSVYLTQYDFKNMLLSQGHIGFDFSVPALFQGEFLEIVCWMFFSKFYGIVRDSVVMSLLSLLGRTRECFVAIWPFLDHMASRTLCLFF